MYKRFSKELKKTKEESSSESESFESQNDELSESSASDHESGSSGNSADVDGSRNDVMDDGDDVLETGVLTIDELEAGDDAVKRKPKRGEVLLYQCSICPEKELLSLRDVREHISSKVSQSILIELKNGRWNSFRNSSSHFPSSFEPASTDFTRHVSFYVF